MHIRAVDASPALSAAGSHISQSATMPAGNMGLIVGPDGPVLTLWQPATATGPVRSLYHRLNEAEAARLAGDLAAWVARRDTLDPG